MPSRSTPPPAEKPEERNDDCLEYRKDDWFDARDEDFADDRYVFSGEGSLLSSPDPPSVVLWAKRDPRNVEWDLTDLVEQESWDREWGPFPSE